VSCFVWVDDFVRYLFSKLATNLWVHSFSSSNSSNLTAYEKQRVYIYDNFLHSLALELYTVPSGRLTYPKGTFESMISPTSRLGWDRWSFPVSGVDHGSSNQNWTMWPSEGPVFAGPVACRFVVSWDVSYTLDQWVSWRPFAQWVYFAYDSKYTYIIYLNIRMVAYLKIRGRWFPAFTISCWFVRVCLMKPDIPPSLACTNMTCCFSCAFQARGWHELSQGHFTLSKIARTDFLLSTPETMFQRFFWTATLIHNDSHLWICFPNTNWSTF